MNVFHRNLGARIKESFPQVIEYKIEGAKLPNILVSFLKRKSGLFPNYFHLEFNKTSKVHLKLFPSPPSFFQAPQFDL